MSSGLTAGYPCSISRSRFNDHLHHSAAITSSLGLLCHEKYKSSFTLSRPAREWNPAASKAPGFAPQCATRELPTTPRYMSALRSCVKVEVDVLGSRP